ncbi:hypothetical protein AVEN_247105-1 [Araneus ventricosus]|uniref:Uncharacterized protein n=1 Tax=Araneus ventricosus TaxID=182803 RepID=A0A4Y2HQP2_ARAVE|nr:hypothetical protein AVEN_247105-1 [Araneus ventricosus]
MNMATWGQMFVFFCNQRQDCILLKLDCLHRCHSSCLTKFRKGLCPQCSGISVPKRIEVQWIQIIENDRKIRRNLSRDPLAPSTSTEADMEEARIRHREELSRGEESGDRSQQPGTNGDAVVLAEGTDVQPINEGEISNPEED